MVKRRGVVEKNEQEKQQFVNKIKHFLLAERTTW